MAVRSIPLSESTPAQRRTFTRDFLNLDLSAEASDEEVNAAIERAQPGLTTIFALDEPTEELLLSEPVVPLTAEESAGRQVGTLGRGDPRWTINIPVVETEDGSGGHDVLVGVNGRAWQIKRGADVSVPHRVVLVLDNAIQEVLRHDEQGDEVRRKAARFTYNVIDRPSPEAIEAWAQAVGAEFCA